MVLIYPAVVVPFLPKLQNICLLLFIFSHTNLCLCAATYVSDFRAAAWWRAPGADPEEAALQ